MSSAKNEIKVSSLKEYSVNEMASRFCEILSKKPELLKWCKPMLWGAPGVGKSSLVYAAADRLAKQLKKRLFIRDIRLLLYNPIDLRGIPVADANREKAIWLRPDMFDFDPSPEVLNILFFDELPNAPISVQNAALQVVQDRRIGEHRLPDNVLIIAAGNRQIDRAGANSMSKSLANRFQHYGIRADLRDWKLWAIPRGIDPRIVAFLGFRESLLFSFDPSSDDNAYPTPRSWEMASEFMPDNNDAEAIVNAVAPCVGMGAAGEFAAYLRVFDKLPNIDDIIAGKSVETPKQPDVLFAVAASLVSKVSQNTYKQDQVENIIRYVSSMPVDFGVMTFRDMYPLKTIQKSLESSKAFLDWAVKHKAVFN